MAHDDKQTGMRRVSRTFLWQDIGTFSATEETFCGICEAHVNASNLNATEVFQKFFDPVSNKVSHPLTLLQDITENEMYVVLAFFMLMAVLKQPTQRSYYSKICRLFIPFFSKTLPLDSLESTVRFLDFTDNYTLNEYQDHAKLLKMYPVVQHLNNKFQNVYLPNHNTVIDESLNPWSNSIFV